MSAEQKAKKLGIKFNDDAKKGYLCLAARVGNLIITSGHTSTLVGKLGDGVSVDQGYAAAREVATKVLSSVHQEFGSLDGLRCVKVLGCVNSTLAFTEQHLVINGFSDLIHEIFGKDGDGFHARSAVGFVQLPTGAAVEVEAIFEVKQ
ncbi:MAG: RidA family protein [Planctomycetota bacterium]|nr:RidA family protein [Planctomycetota bacterium]MDA1141895.1 RidA family protein [Planctomycetota bacterium]